MKNIDALKKIIRQALKPPSRLSVCDWADTYATLPSTSSEPGRYRTDRVPYFKEPMQAFTDNRVSRVVVKASSQTGKSTVLLNILGRYAHLAPCPCMIIQPTLADAMDFSKRRLSPFIKDTKAITNLFYEKEKTRDANQTILSKFFRGGSVVLVGANSPSGLASRPIKILLCDEVDRYPTSAGKEGDSILIATARTTTYFDAKTAIFSTPTVKGLSRIDIEYELGTQEEWRHVCPSCGSLEMLSYQQMVCDFDERQDKSGKRTVLVKGVKWLCPNCHQLFDEVTMRNAEQLYHPMNPAALNNGVRSFFVNGFASPWLTWNQIMREWLEAQGNPMLESVVMNTRFAMSYELPAEIDEPIADRNEDYPAQVPDDVLILTAGVDVQKNRLEFVVYGWNASAGYGILSDIIRGEPNNPSTWAELNRRLTSPFYKQDGSTMTPARVFVDSGFMTDHVYNFCRRHVKQGFFAVKGQSVFGAPLIHKTGYLKEAGLYLVVLNVDAGKSEVYSRLQAGTLHFGRDDDSLTRHFDETFFDQLTAEHRVRKVVNGISRDTWELISRDKRNEALDVTVYALAALQSCFSPDEHSFWQSLTNPQPTRRKIISRRLDP